jgi:hypothetical protein
MSGYDDSYDFEAWLAKNHPDALHSDVNRLYGVFREEYAAKEEAKRIEREKKQRDTWIADQFRLLSEEIEEEGIFKGGFYSWNPKPAWLAPKLPRWLKRLWPVSWLLRKLDIRAGRYFLAPYVPLQVSEIDLSEKPRPSDTFQFLEDEPELYSDKDGEPV